MDNKDIPSVKRAVGLPEKSRVHEKGIVMMIMNRLGVSTLAALLFLPAAALAVDPDPNPGGTVDVLSYFISTASGCMVPNVDPTVAWKATLTRRATTGEQCPNVGSMFFTLEGATTDFTDDYVPPGEAPKRRWTTGTFFSDFSDDRWWLKETEEWFYNNYPKPDDDQSSCALPSKPDHPVGADRSTTFRDHATGRKGLKWMPLTFDAFDPASYSWKDDPTDGDLFDNYLYGGVCYGVPMCERSAIPIGRGQAYPVRLEGWITDKRGDWAQSPPPFSDQLTVYAVVKEGTFTGDNWVTWETERYYYGKFFTAGQWWGLGLVKYEKLLNGELVLTAGTESKFLINCNVGLQCNSCPDP